MHSRHHPNGGAAIHCDNGRLETLIAAHQAGTDPAALGEIIGLTQNRALALIRFYRSARYCPENELLSDINFKLMRAVDKFDRQRGSGFSFISRIILNVLCTSVTTARRSVDRYVEWDEAAASKLHTNGENQTRDTIDDFVHRIRAGARTTLIDPREIDMTRWYVESFVNGAFELRLTNAPMRRCKSTE